MMELTREDLEKTLDVNTRKWLAQKSGADWFERWKRSCRAGSLRTVCGLSAKRKRGRAGVGASDVCRAVTARRLMRTATPHEE